MMPSRGDVIESQLVAHTALEFLSVMYAALWLFWLADPLVATDALLWMAGVLVVSVALQSLAPVPELQGRATVVLFIAVVHLVLTLSIFLSTMAALAVRSALPSAECFTLVAMTIAWVVMISRNTRLLVRAPFAE